MLTVLCLDDGSIKRMFEENEVGTERFKIAISKQYTDALSYNGISDAAEIRLEPVNSSEAFQNSRSSCQ